MASPWERLPNESEEAYARFLIYRGLGPLRTLTGAESLASGRKKRHASGNWTRDQVLYEWKRRAIAWDISQLTENGERLAFTFIAVLERMTEQLAETVAGDKAKPKSAKDVVEWMKALTPYLTPALIEKVRNRSVGCNDLPVDTGGSDGSSE